MQYVSALIFVLMSVHAAWAWTPYAVHGGSYFYGFAVADFDKDGNPDVAYADSLAATRAIRPSDAIIYLNNMNQGLRKIYTEDFSWHPNNTAPNPHHLIEKMVAVDINNDTWLDIVAVANSHDAVVAYLNPGASGPWTRQVLTTSTPGAVNVAHGDADGDGDQDIFVVMRSQTASWPAPKSGLGWLRNDGGGVFTYADIDISSLEIRGEPRTVLAFDVWGDGRDEITVSNIATGKLLTYRLIGSTWHKHVASGVEVKSFYNAALDIDGDGLKEFIFATREGIYFARTNWNAVIPEVGELFPISLGSGEYVSEIIPADVDGDGVIDLAFSVAHGGLYFAKETVGVWGFTTVSPQQLNYLNMAVMDWNGDGRADVLGGIEYPENFLQVWIQPSTPLEPFAGPR